MTTPDPRRSIFERMTNPTIAEQTVTERLRALSTAEVARIIEHMAQVMEHLAKTRKDVVVQRHTGSQYGFTVMHNPSGQVDLATLPPNPLIR